MSEETGHYRAYIEKKFSKAHLDVITAANNIIEEYEAKGFSLTLRQIYYQFVARGWLANKDSEYDRLGSIISDGRMAGLVSWTAIEDRNRNLMGIRTYDRPSQALKEIKKTYATDKWADQPWRPEVWVEKAALEGVVGSMCNKLQVDFFACRGYNSQSEQWRAGQRFAGYVQKGQRPIVFHLGDHDPSGIDMTRDNRDRLSMFAGVPVIVQRLALNMNQIEQYRPPPNPAKVSDSRFQSYSEKYGDESWELDALNPEIIHRLIEDAVLAVRDQALWEQAELREISDLRMIDEMIDMFG
jgi:hypothetical protein